MAFPSVEEIRGSFPALMRRHGGLPVAYFDGPGGTQVPRSVAEAMTEYLYRHNANAHWAYPSSEETDETIRAARRTVATFLNAAPEEIVFGANMTTLTFHLARALAGQFDAGDEIIVTELDHHANVAPWRRLELECGVVVHASRFDTASGELDWTHFESLVSERTKLIAVGAASNALGTVNDLARARRAARAVDALLFVDAVHFAPHELVDVQEIGCDFLACSAYKFYGPHVGILYGRPDLLRTLDVPKLEPAPDHPPERWETGTLNHEGLAGTTAAIEFLAGRCGGMPSTRNALKETFEVLNARGRTLIQRLWEGLDGIPGVHLYGPQPEAPRTPTVSFTVEDWSARSVAARLGVRAVFVSHGDFYAQTAVQRLHPGGLVRAGCACYTTMHEIDRLLTAVDELR